MHGIPNGRSLAVVNALVWDGTGRDPEPRRLIEVRDGRIARVAPLDGGSAPRDLPVLDAEGRFVMPGLLDCHVHLIYCRFGSLFEIDQWPLEYHTLRAAENAATLLSYGYTTVRDVGTRGAIASAVRDAIDQGLVPGPRVRASGPVITSEGGHADSTPPWMCNHVSLGVVVNGVDEVRRAVRIQAKQGVDNIKVGITGAEASPYCTTEQTAFSPEELNALVDEARRFGKTVACHAQSYLGARMAVDAGVTTIEHGTRMDDETIARLAAAEDTYLVPTMGTIYSVLELSKNPKAVDEMRINEPIWLDSLRRARAAGVKIAVGSDLGNRYLQGEQAIELELLVKQGFAPEEVLVAATRTSARAMHVADRVGTLEPGKYADLLLLNASPLADVGILRQRSQIHRVIKGGEVLTPAELAPEVVR
jgi:imidazolonepropionase-like amidohydrolase